MIISADFKGNGRMMSEACWDCGECVVKHIDMKRWT